MHQTPNSALSKQPSVFHANANFQRSLTLGKMGLPDALGKTVYSPSKQQHHLSYSVGSTASALAAFKQSQDQAQERFSMKRVPSAGVKGKPPRNPQRQES
jgi:hypothetical protein